MKSLKSGKSTLRAEVNDISEHGFWILLATIKKKTSSNSLLPDVFRRGEKIVL
jgi:hypothetical protein